jgi:isopropylmalate/homocitrate/citramalate synthase
MSTDANSPETSAIVEVSPETHALVEQEMPNESDEIKQETKALIDAIRKRAQSEVQSAGDVTRETYLSAVRKAREAIEQNQLIDPKQIEKSMELIQKEAEKNWNAIVNEVETLGNRLTEAAKAAWEKLMPPEKDQ